MNEQAIELIQQRIKLFEHNLRILKQNQGELFKFDQGEDRYRTRLEELNWLLEELQGLGKPD